MSFIFTAGRNIEKMLSQGVFMVLLTMVSCVYSCHRKTMISELFTLKKIYRK